MDTTTLLSGVFLWLHDIPACDGGNLKTIIARCKQAGIAGLLIKDTDGGAAYGDWDQVKALVDAAHAAGLIVGTWGYHYGNDINAEVAITVQAIAHHRPDIRVVDVEQEWEDHPNAAALAVQFCDALKAAEPDLPLGYSPVGAVYYHLRGPYRQFTDEGFCMLPQLYWVAYQWTPAYTVKQFYDAVAQYQLASTPIFPAYEDSPNASQGCTDEDLATFLSDCKAQGVTGVSGWVYDFLDAAAWNRVSQAAAVYPAPVAPTPVPDPKVAELEAEVATLTQELQTEQARAAALEAKIAAAINDLSGNP